MSAMKPETHTQPRLQHGRRFLPLLVLAVSVCSLSIITFWLSIENTHTMLSIVVISLILISFTCLLVLYFSMQKGLLSPLTSLQDWADEIGKGQLNTRIAEHGSDEFQQLARTLNTLSGRLQSLTEDMQSQVELQTQHISNKTRSLEIIYDVAASINMSRDLNDLLTRFLHTLKDVVNARAAVVRLVADDNQMRLIASIGLDDEVIAREQLIPSESCLCGSAFDTGEVQYQFDITQCDKIIGHSFFNDEQVGMIAVPLQYRDKTLGVYNLFVDQDMISDVSEINELLTSIGRHLGMAIDKARLDSESNRLSIIEERTRFAHELHDSLAQTMASLRFQARVLDENLRKGDEPSVWHELEQIEINLDEAYTEVRELITHFRAPIDKRGLVPAVETLAKRFKNQSGIHLFLQQEWNITHLPTDVEVEVLRIIQESLNNIKKHSQADTVRVILRSDLQGQCHILIEDDGIGINTDTKNDDLNEHYGLKIMSERAQRINGEVKIESESGEGTRITLTFSHAPPSTPSNKINGVYIQLPSKQINL